MKYQYSVEVSFLVTLDDLSKESGRMKLETDMSKGKLNESFIRYAKISKGRKVK